MNDTGNVTLCGSGPGDPGLITVAARDAIAGAEVIVYDYLVNSKLLEYAPPSCEKIYVGKKGGRHTMEQEQINELLCTKAREGNRVVRLKGGDPYIFGRGSEEALYLKEKGVSFAVIPGIPAALGAAAYAGIPLTDRRYNSSVTFVTGHEDPAKKESTINWRALARSQSTLVFYMGVKNLPSIARRLIEQGMDGATPVSVVRWATTPLQQTVTGTLETIARKAAKAGIKPPALTVVGKVNQLHKSIAWFENLPLFGKKIAVTRSRTQASALSGKLAELGADTIEMPVIEISPQESTKEIDRAIRSLSSYAWVVFTSVNGVSLFMDRVYALGFDARIFAPVKIAVIGSATASRLKEYGIRPNFEPSKFTSAVLFEELRARETIDDKKFLLARADIAGKELPENLKQYGARVDDIIVYKTVPGTTDTTQIETLIEEGSLDGVTFTSSSTVKYFIDALGKAFIDRIKDSIAAFSIGPETTKALKTAGIRPATQASVHTIPGLVESIRNYYDRNQ
ncbi:MAG: uroporphyrinogen-III C-methyltransferase [Chitinivibrionales bacterium]|nr:uroporphyrinogen-III C-methyltransferase [Chitinivibrionales bacterium]